MIQTTHRVSRVILLAGALCVAAVAAAALKDKPPDGLSLSGTDWQIDPYHSDDPVEVIQNAENAAQERADRDRGGIGGDSPRPGDDTWGRGGLPGRPSRDGGWGTDPGRTSTSVDPWGGTQSATIQYGSRSRNQFLDQLRENPQELTFRQVEQHVTVTADGIETDCTAGSKEPLADSYGDGERRCGWNGRAWVVETTRGHNFTRTDRYELAKNGQTLKFITTASGTGMPNVRIERAYEVARHTK